jgi:type II restriction/modification system DNA methylase subunit YeeA
MNKAKLKSYAPQARKDFIAAVTARANLLGLSERAGELEVATSQPQGDATVIAGQAWPIKVHSQRQQLITRIQKDGFTQTMEAVAYTWFNRFVALRYMELHDYLGHGHRALSSLEGSLPDILTHATDLVQNGVANGGLPGLKPAMVVEMRLAGNRDGELYRLLLVAQCNALSDVMPFLFERIDDETELLLPDNLLRTDSVIAKLVAAIDEEDWGQVEIIGWLYQFYISEKKDEVIGKVVKSEDIPAATQLFTPNWIVQYLVQNSVGRLWLMANPASTLTAQWSYYIAPAGQTPEVQAQLDTLTRTRIGEDGDSLNPESITLLDPACGSGHILVEAYDVLKAIYLERGYQPRAIPRLILEKNLFGLDIDDRAAQMAGFALLMKARADDRHLFKEPIELNVLSLQESKGLDANDLNSALQSVISGVIPEPILPTISVLIATFAHAKTFGSLIQIPPALNTQLMILTEFLQHALQNGDLYSKAAAQDLWPLVAQARVLGMKFDAVVANPPYMGSKGMNAALKDYALATFPDSKSDLFAMFIERGFQWCKASGFNSMVTMQSWMFLSSYESMRGKFLQERTIQTMAHLGARAFSEISGEVVQTTAFVAQSQHFGGFRPVFFRLVDGQEEQKKTSLLAGENRFDNSLQDDFIEIPGNPIAYWLSDAKKKLFKFKKISSVAKVSVGMQTGDNSKYIRYWFEVSREASELNASEKSGRAKWFPCNKGGQYRKWFGNTIDVINWAENGFEIKSNASGAYIRNESGYFKPALTWSRISTGELSFRYVDENCVHNDASCFITADEEVIWNLLDFLNSKISSAVIGDINPTLNLLPGQVNSTPFLSVAGSVGKRCVSIAREDWDSNEISWNYLSFPLLKDRSVSLSGAWTQWESLQSLRRRDLRALEEENNRLFINAYGLQGELTAEVADDQITLARADREKDSQRLISYVIGCIMGRYSLDEPGLIYANAGNVGFDATRYAGYPADADGIVPITDELWFEDEAASRVREFLLVVWGDATLAENMAWLAENLGIKAGETPDEAIRRYLSDKFYKDHLQTYKKRPIYWLFSSGKQGAFQALVYLHRYHEGTLARMRAEYVVPLTGKIQSRIDMLEKDTAAASSTAARNKLTKEVEKLKKKHVELLAYDEQLRHYADMRITLDLDDGVKVNYGKFGNLLAEVKAVTGGKDDE